MWYLKRSIKQARSLLRLGLQQRHSWVACSLCCALLLLYSSSDCRSRSGTTPVPPDTLTEQPVALPNVEDLRIFAYSLNKRQQVHHEEEFGATLEPSDPVIVVQVHNRWRYLEKLLHSLSRVRGIERALIVFSHDFYDAHMLSLPKAVTFCRVMQIFFPYSTQLYPHEFPGVHPNDCPRNIHYEQARKIKCNNADYPDQYGHYRESKFTQIKHHWWWKINVVMESLNLTRNHEGPIMLLEEDYYVAPDYIDAVRLLLSKRRAFCGENTCLCMVGNNDYASKKSLIDAEFCMHDDYNWDLTLTAVANNCLPAGSRTVSLRVSRVFHIGECGVHRRPKQCRAVLLRKALRVIPKEGFGSERMRNLRPIHPRPVRLPKVSGGWADVRDHQLCVKMTLWGS
ncbi:hypothetical protein HPB52_003936 [Rhipicephalus sanguineus]|uniref:Alpha-1,6-mannosyl-glycoprotein 2-beta-N-acetylglucosaminyltransferase n=1 Tax=Rhipicephalus sanguineus TaxID=34632 RepID=A0A9D4T5G1_RHISA|nr:hypothetical protein HPB52_003936 [Rhipicephalus sanguineus]